MKERKYHFGGYAGTSEKGNRGKCGKPWVRVHVLCKDIMISACGHGGCHSSWIEKQEQPHLKNCFWFRRREG